MTCALMVGSFSLIALAEVWLSTLFEEYFLKYCLFQLELNCLVQH